jgi:pimeloyl-ACP methyl ester carboxylesterase
MDDSSARRQFPVLYRNFLAQIVDTELIATHGDPSRLLAQIGALLVSISIILAIEIIPQYRKATAAQIRAGSWGDQEFLIGTTIAVVGIFTVFAWDSIFPNRRDTLVLGSLPIRQNTISRAKLAATGTGLAVCLVAVNGIIGLTYPFVAGGVKTFFAYWATIAAAGSWIFCSLLAMQGLSALTLSYRRFLKVSNALQVGSFFAILAVFFLTPGPLDLDVSQGIPNSVRLLPSFWFLGLFQTLNGCVQPTFAPLAGRALTALIAALSTAGLIYALAQSQVTRRIVEEPDIVPADRARPPSRVFAWAVRRATAKWKPLDRAMLLFIARTLTRSRLHRNLMAVFGGLGIAISITYAKALLYGNSQMYELARRYGFQTPHWYEPNTPLMATGFILLILAVLGTRAAFSLPLAMRANWIFRVTDVQSPNRYFTAVRKSMLALIALPVWLAASVFYLSVWGGPEALGHVLVLLCAGIIVVDLALSSFCKMPFACNYLPGASNLRIRLPIYGTVFLAAVDIGTRIERTALKSAARSILLAVVVLALLIYARRSWNKFASWPLEQLQFEARPMAEVAPLDLRGDGMYGRNYRYVDLLDTPPEPSRGQRAWRLALTMAIAITCFCAAGFVYEQISELRNPLPPRQGRSIDIGGRSLNYSCIGQGSPAVIFENGSGGAGMDWTRLQREVAQFTRACWYDRAGQGWSDAAPFPHPASAISDDLHRLLGAAAVTPPYVLAGLSSGGICVRVYAKRYPSDVAGMVLIDSAHVDEDDPITPPGGGYIPYFPQGLSVLAQVLRPIGVLRVIMPAGVLSPFETRTFAESLKEEMVYESQLEARAVGSLGDIPLIVLTAGRHRVNPPESPVEARQQLAWENKWIEGQKQLARLSTHAQQRVFPQARHNLLEDRPQEVLKAIVEVVNAARVSLRPDAQIN